MRGFVKFVGAAALGYMGVLGLAHADAIEVTCGDDTLGEREVTVDPAKDGGFCYAKNGNFNGDDFSGILPDAQLIGKNGQEINYPGGATSGAYSFDPSLWDEFETLYLAFHFGGGGECNPDADETNNPNDQLPGDGCLVDPDSFIVELAFGVSSGNWSTNWGDQWGLSNIYLIGECKDENNCRPELDVPEPGTLALLGLGLAGLGFGARRRKA